MKSFFYRSVSHAFSYLDDIADIDIIRGKSVSSSTYKYLRRDEEISPSTQTNKTSANDTFSNVVRNGCN